MSEAQGDLRLISPTDFTSLHPEALDSFLADLPPASQTFNCVDETIKYPGSVEARLELVADAIRQADRARGALIYHGTILMRVFNTSPQTIEALPEDRRRKVMELIQRISPEITS